MTADECVTEIERLMDRMMPYVPGDVRRARAPSDDIYGGVESIIRRYRASNVQPAVESESTQ